MHSARFDVLVHGFRSGGGVHPAAALQLALKLDSRTARLLAERFPCVVLSALPQDHAERAKSDLVKYGAQVELRQSKLGRRSSSERGLDSEPSEGAGSAGDYELGEILAPLGHVPLPQKKPAAGPAPRPRISLFQDDDEPTVVDGPRGYASLAGDDDPIQLAIDIPVRTWASGQIPGTGISVGEPPKPKREPLIRRFRRWLSVGLSSVGPWVLHGVLFIVITLITLAAVSWAVHEPRTSREALAPFGDGSILGD